MFDIPASAETAPSTAWTDRQAVDSPPPAVALPVAGPATSKPPAHGETCPEALADEITTLAGHLNAAQHRFLKLLDEFDRVEGWAGPGVRSLAHWLGWKCGIGELAAREKVRVARALRELPLTGAAFERGEISYSKVRAMTRAATPRNEEQLLNIARHGTAEHMERLVRVYRRCRKRAEESPLEAGIRREERFYIVDGEDGEMMTFGGRVPVEQGRLLVRALDAMVAEMEEDGRGAAGTSRTDGAARADGAPRTDGSGLDGHLAETSRRANASQLAEADARNPEEAPGPAEDVPAETPAAGAGENVSAETFSGAGPAAPPLKPVRERRATALVHIAEHYLATGGKGAAALRSGEAHQVLVHVNANDAHPDNRADGGHTAYADDRRHIAPHVARQLACDAARRTVLEDDRGKALDIGRRSRTVPWRIAHALRLRDGGCRFPGCGRSRWTDAHHIRHWADGGETSLDNLVTLCRHHHRALHRGEYGVGRGADGGLIFVDGAGHVIPRAFHPRSGGGRGSGGAETAAERVERLRAGNRGRGVEIGKSTAVTRWAGERMDYSTAVEWLQCTDGGGAG